MTVAPVSDNRVREGKTFEAKWEGLSQADGIGAPVKGPGQADRTVHIYGTWDGATVVLKGSLEDNALHGVDCLDALGSPVSMVADGMVALSVNPYWFWPEVSGAGASTDLTVVVLSRSTVA